MHTILLLALACSAGKDSGSDESGTTNTTDTEDSGTTTTPEMEITATLTATGVDVVITNGSGDYMFGMTQAGTDDNWTGEDCDKGYDTKDGNLQFCHKLPATGGTLTYPDPVKFPLKEGETLFKAGLPGTVGYYVADSTGACAVWGDAAAVAHWDALGCAKM